MPIDRRRLLFAGLISTYAPRLVLAAAPTERRLAVVVLRGAWDGLAVVPAYGDPAFAGLRGALDMGRPGGVEAPLDLDGFFGLHPALEPLIGFWRQGELLPVHAVATTHRGRSHFEAQDELEAGMPRVVGRADGWLNRALGELPSPADRRLALAVGPSMPLTLRGEAPVASWAPSRMPTPSADLMTRIAALWQQDAELGPALAEGLKAQSMAGEVLSGDERMGGGRGAGAFVAIARAAGGFLAADRGPRIAVLDIGGWDTHSAQGTVRGRLVQSLAPLGAGITAMAAELGPAWRNTVVLCVSEFGRTAAPNGTGGTDHGTGGLALLVGGAVKGGRVLADWPGLGRGALFEGRDLKPTLDTRAVYKAVLRDHLGVDVPAIERKVFPDTATIKAPQGLFRA
ncbi:DUF1501 domain-containing protein [Desertibaculum subflavum]|uniref:DUF1501 domain-containing protein n=1 Tax=Desertibaculum subflavum TaxID=2268458 RepID=UPI000E669499